MFELTGKNALVTGASGGLGGAIATALHAQGAVVTLSGTRREALDTLASSLGDRVHVVTADLSDPESTEALIPAAQEAMGEMNILVNNAGMTRDMLSMRLSDDQWQKVIDINLGSTFRLCRAALKNMMRKRAGRIINITSIVGVTGNAGQANYAASKAGMIGMSKSMAAEVAGRGVTINCVAPGFIETPMTEALNEAQHKQLLERIPAGRMGLPGDIAACVAYVASDEAAYMTGQTLHVNGGMAMI